jgi:hypothetical protein
MLDFGHIDTTIYSLFELTILKANFHIVAISYQLSLKSEIRLFLEKKPSTDQF